MREFILVHEADVSGGELLKERVREYVILTKHIESVVERDIGIVDFHKLSEDVREKFMIDPEQCTIKGGQIYFSKGSSYGWKLNVMESPKEIYSKMYEDEKSKKEI